MFPIANKTEEEKEEFFLHLITRIQASKFVVCSDADRDAQPSWDGWDTAFISTPTQRKVWSDNFPH